MTQALGMTDLKGEVTWKPSEERGKVDNRDYPQLKTTKKVRRKGNLKLYKTYPVGVSTAMSAVVQGEEDGHIKVNQQPAAACRSICLLCRTFCLLTFCQILQLFITTHKLLQIRLKYLCLVLSSCDLFCALERKPFLQKDFTYNQNYKGAYLPPKK